MQVHEHYCGKCKQVYECGHRGCKLVFIRVCISCKLTMDDLDQQYEYERLKD